MARKRANSEGSIRKRKDGRWERRYTAGHDPATGKTIYKNVLGKTQAFFEFVVVYIEKVKAKGREKVCSIFIPVSPPSYIPQTQRSAGPPLPFAAAPPESAAVFFIITAPC